MTMEPGGFGPWFCAFVVNTGKDPKKHTHVVSHCMPHLVVDALNRAGGCWIILLKIGPFNVWQESVAFLQAWLYQTRGKIHRIERGFELYKHYAERYRLHLWSQTRSREDAVAYWQQQQQQPQPKPPQLVPNGEPSTAIAATMPNAANVSVPYAIALKRYTDWLTENRTLFESSSTIDQLRTLQKQLLLNGSDFLLGWFFCF